MTFDLEQVETAGPEVLQASGGTVGAQRIITSNTSEIPNLASHRLVILFFDFSGAQEEEIDREIDAGINYVNKQMTAADIVAVVSFNTMLSVDQDFTPDRDQVLKALN